MWVTMSLSMLVAAPLVLAAYVPQPAIHFTPPCYFHSEDWHDTAGAMRHPVTKDWHVFVGPVWQHLKTSNLVDFAVAGAANGMGGSGTLIYDHKRNLTVALTGAVTAFTNAAPDLTGQFKPAGQIFKTIDPVPAAKVGCWDPVVWWDERVSRYFAMAACGHNNPRGMSGGGGYGLQQTFSSPELSGPGANWTQQPTPFLEWKKETVPLVGTWPRTHEFVTPDLFPLGSESWVFLTTSYGGLRQTGLNTTAAAGMLEYDYSNYLIGPRPPSGGAFVPDDTKSGPWDWSPFAPVAAVAAAAAADAAGKKVGGGSLTFATAKGMEQFGCCPKTAGDANRRVLFGWINNGWDQGSGEPDRRGMLPNNTLSLPRDLRLSSAATGGHMQQTFVPELQKLRRAHTHLGKQPLPAKGVAGAAFVKEASGLQLEIRATFSVGEAALAAVDCTEKTTTGSTAAGTFGIMVLAAADKSEYTVIGFDPARSLFLLDRTHSGLAFDADVRAGPWPATGAKTVTVHAFVDHAVVEMIANATATTATARSTTVPIAAWVSPTSAASDGVALFSEVPGVVLESLDVWTLATPQHQFDTAS